MRKTSGAFECVSFNPAAILSTPVMDARNVSVMIVSMILLMVKVVKIGGCAICNEKPSKKARFREASGFLLHVVLSTPVLLLGFFAFVSNRADIKVNKE